MGAGPPEARAGPDAGPTAGGATLSLRSTDQTGLEEEANVSDLWTLRPDAPRMSARDADLSGFHVFGTDGEVGVVVATSGERGRSHLVLAIGHPVLGRRVVVPARYIRHVEHSCEALYVTLSREQVRGAPPYDEAVGHGAHRPAAEAYFGAIEAGSEPPAGTLRQAVRPTRRASSTA